VPLQPSHDGPPATATYVLAVDQQPQTCGPLRHTREIVEIQVRTPLIPPDDQQDLAEFLRGLGYEPSVDASRPRLMPREMEVLRLMAKGYTYREIADKLFIANGTVRMHAESIKKKFRVRQRSELPRSYDRRASFYGSPTRLEPQQRRNSPRLSPPGHGNT
jgi:DNA-binding NarL/FixJ family response regulator